MIVIKPIEAPKPYAEFEKYAWVIYLAWALFGICHLMFVNGEHIPIKIVFPLILLAKSLYNLYDNKKKDRTFIIDELGFAGVFEGYETRLRVNWDEIRRVRFEKSFIVLYLESSISRAIEFDQFEVNDQKVIIKEFSEIVKQRNLEFFNAAPEAVE